MALIGQPPVSAPVDCRYPAWAAWFTTITSIVAGMTRSGTTADRPTSGLYTGRPYFDTTLGKPIWYEGPDWVDATGAVV